LSSFIAKAGAILVDKKAEAIVAAELARDNYPGATDAGHVIADFIVGPFLSGYCQ